MRITCVCDTPTIAATARVLKPEAMRATRNSSPARRSRAIERRAARWMEVSRVGMTPTMPANACLALIGHFVGQWNMTCYELGLGGRAVVQIVPK
jgi:hypothetical protein